MPNKTIYVSDDDLPLFERAQELTGDSLSAVVVRALRRLIEVEEARKGSLDEVTVLVGPSGAHQRKRFIGVLLARQVQDSAKANGTDILKVYRTAGKRFALHTHTMPDWEAKWGDPEFQANPQNWGMGTGILSKIMSWGFDWVGFREAGDYRLQVFETLDDLKPHIPDDLYQAVVQAMEFPDVEDLDI